MRVHLDTGQVGLGDEDPRSHTGIAETQFCFGNINPLVKKRTMNINHRNIFKFNRSEFM